MIALVLDTETSGLSPEKDQIVELACALFHVESRQILGSFSCLLPFEGETLETEKITGISKEMTRLVPLIVGAHFFDIFQACWSQSDVVIAHNAEFDRGFIERFYPQFPKKRWVCSYREIEHSVPAGKIVHMCADLGIPIAGAHRALNDVLMLCEILKLNQDLELYLSPDAKRYQVQAKVSFEQKDLAKNAGFQWDANKRIWVKTFFLKKPEPTLFPFPIVII